MSYANLNGDRVLSGELSLPVMGTWVADVRVDADSTEPLPRDVVLALGELELHGAVTSGGSYGGVTTARIVGGKGKLATELPSKFYRDSAARVPIGDALRTAGESLAPSSEGVVLDAWLTGWARTAGPASSALMAILVATGGTWRVLPDGAVWVGRNAWPFVTLDHVVTQEWPAERRVELATSEPEKLMPGVTFLDRRVAQVRHVLEPGRLRTQVWFV